MKILPEVERGGTGTRLQAIPVPPATHSPKPEIQGLC
jgi:hypothetical protein